VLLQHATFTQPLRWRRDEGNGIKSGCKQLVMQQGMFIEESL